MKPYKERLPLIDAAINELEGEFPPTAIGYSGRGYYAKGDFANILYGVNTGDIATRDEFNQRKAERQNKPDWSSAPKWANWLCQGVVGMWYWWSHKPAAKGMFWMSDIGDNDHPDFKMGGASKGEAIGNWQDTLEQRPEQKEQDMNDWYEKGELPPVGIVVEFNTQERGKKAEWVRCDILAVSGDWIVFTHSGFKHPFVNNNLEYFRPLRTETDELVEHASKLVPPCADSKHTIKTLINADYRKTKPMSEDEFVDYAVDKYEGLLFRREWKDLYRAGCRFLDKGE